MNELASDSEIAQAWIAELKHPKGKSRPFGATDMLMSLSLADIERTLAITAEICRISDGDKEILTNLAAGPLETALGNREILQDDARADALLASVRVYKKQDRHFAEAMRFAFEWFDGLPPNAMPMLLRRLRASS